MFFRACGFSFFLGGGLFHLGVWLASFWTKPCWAHKPIGAHGPASRSMKELHQTAKCVWKCSVYQRQSQKSNVKRVASPPAQLPFCMLQGHWDHPGMAQLLLQVIGTPLPDAPCRRPDSNSLDLTPQHQNFRSKPPSPINSPGGN